MRTCHRTSHTPPQNVHCPVAQNYTRDGDNSKDLEKPCPQTKEINLQPRCVVFWKPFLSCLTGWVRCNVFQNGTAQKPEQHQGI
eukprot:671404-Amphidinium_carterae.1